MSFHSIAFRNTLSPIIFLCSVSYLTFLSGCSALATNKKLYEGEIENAAVIRSYDSVIINYIDNMDLGVSFVGREREFSVAPGVHTLVVEYADFWNETPDEHEKVTSAPIKIRFTAEPSQSYQIQHRAISSYEQSVKFAEKPVLFVRNILTGKNALATFELATPKRFLPALRFDSTPEYQFADEGLVNVPVDAKKINSAQNTIINNSEENRLQKLQGLWVNASKEEKARFLQWITTK